MANTAIPLLEYRGARVGADRVAPPAHENRGGQVPGVQPPRHVHQHQLQKQKKKTTSKKNKSRAGEIRGVDYGSPPHLRKQTRPRVQQ